MQRTKVRGKKVTAILSADIHLTDRIPVARTDDFLGAQLKKLSFLTDLQNQHDAVVLDAGDLFDKWKSSPWLVNRAFKYLPDTIITIPGNHDLPEHNQKLYYKSALKVLEDNKKGITVLRGMHSTTNFDDSRIVGIPFGQLKHFDLEKNELLKDQLLDSPNNIALVHELTWPGKKPPWDQHGYSADDVIDILSPYFNLIVTGDNHDGFTKYSEDEECLLVNPGSMMRSNADRDRYRPRCYLYYASDNSVEPVYYPIEEGVLSRDHITTSKERDKRIEAYIERMNTQWEAGLSFTANMQKFFKENKVPKLVKELIWHHLETEKG